MTGDATEDRFLDGRLLLRQSAKGYRAGADALLLAAAVAPADQLMEAGCGPGAALLATALRFEAATLAGIERDVAAVALARENISANGLQDRVSIVEGDIFENIPTVYRGIFFNPPFAAVGEGAAPRPERTGARVTEYALDAWIARLSNHLRGGGVLTLIHRADKTGEILAAMDGRLGAAAIYPVRPHADAPASRVLVRGVKGARAPMTLLRGIDLHDRSGAKFTPEADAIFRGRTAIDW
ncbi:MAG: methyltransferase [Hyphomonadaceae bacterium]|nr:MAG: methyltransferase [Caulobacteraceae bacterium]MBT9447327.1 methyltransferase [Hyphomonadaceae bacterium]TPW06363.1 MAG: methyltransferase [Alphaproteobacteria bacterium]